MQIEPVGVVRSPVTEALDERWGDVVAEIHVRPELAPGLKGIEQWSHVMVVYLMHEASFDLARDLEHRPRGRADMPELGVFAQRDRVRPNGIGVSTAEIISVDGAVLTVRRLDAIDGTPVLDIKPWADVYDNVSGALTPIWFLRLMQGYF